MNGKTSDIIRVGLKRGHLLVRVVVEDSQLEIVRACYEPILAGNESDTSHWNFGNFKGFDKGSCLMIVDIHAPVVQAGQEPWFSRMEVDCLDAVGSLEQLSLKFELVKVCCTLEANLTYIDIQQHSLNCV